MLGRFLVFIAGLLVVALFAALLAPYFVDWTSFRQDFEKQASIILGKKVVVYGDVSARIIPFPSVTMTDVRVAQEGEREPLVAVERFSMDMELAPFLSGEARIFEMRIEKPKVRLRLTEDGSLDWVRSGKPSIPAKTVVLENVHIIDGELEFDDRQTGRKRIVSGLDMHASAKSLKGPWRFEGNGALDGVNGQFSASTGSYEGGGELRVISHVAPEGMPFSLDLEGNLKMEELRLRYRGNFAASYRAASGNQQDNLRGPRATGQFELANDAIRLPEYRLELGDPTDPYVVTGKAAFDTGLKPEFLLTAEGQQVDISRIGGGDEAKTSRHPEEGSAMTRLQALLAVVGDIPIPSVPGQASIHLPSILAGDTTYRNIVIEARPAEGGWSISKATAELPGRTVLEARGTLMSRGGLAFDGELLLATNQPSGLAAWLAGSVDPAIRGLDQAGFSATVSLRPGLQRFEGLELAVGGDILRGRAERQALDGGKPSISVDLSGGALDIAAFRALSALIFGGDASRAVLDHSLAVKLDLKSLSAFGAVARDVSSVFTMDNGVLNVSRITIGDVLGASVNATGNFLGTLADPKFKLDGKIHSDDPGPLLIYLHEKLPEHPVLDRMTVNSSFLADSDLHFSMLAGEGSAWPVQVAIDGTANGTALTAQFSSEVLGFTGEGGFSFDISAENSDTSILLGQFGLEPLPIDYGAGGKVSLAVSRQSSDQAEIALTFAADDALLAISGEGDVGAGHFLDGQYSLKLQSDDLEPYLLLNGIAIPQMGAGLPMKMQAAINVSKDAIVLDNLEGTADHNVFSGRLSLGRGISPKLTGKMSLDTLDFAWLAEAAIGPVTDAAGNWSVLPLPETAEAGVTAAVNVDVAKLWIGHALPVEGFKGVAVFDGRSAGLQDGEGRFADGDIHGSVSVANAEGQAFLRTQFEVDGASLAALSWQRDGVPVFDAKAGFSALVEASGRTISELVGQISGSGAVTFGPLTVKGLNLALLPSILDQADALGNKDITAKVVEPLVSGLLGDGSAELKNLQVPFSVAGSVLRVSNLGSETADATLNLDAEADLNTRTLDGTLRVSFKPGEDALAGADPAVSVHFSGGIEAPDTAVDVSELAGFLSLRAFEQERRRVELLQAEIMEKQRLRREVAYFKGQAAAREAARIRAEEEARKAEEEARRAQEALDALKDVQRALEEQGAATGSDAAPAKPANSGKQSGDIQWNVLPAPSN